MKTNYVKPETKAVRMNLRKELMGFDELKSAGATDVMVSEGKLF
jgi:hypothetical protein